MNHMKSPLKQSLCRVKSVSCLALQSKPQFYGWISIGRGKHGTTTIGFIVMAFPLNRLPIFYMLFEKVENTFWQDLLALYFGWQSYCYFFGDNLERKVQKREAIGFKTTSQCPFLGRIWRLRSQNKSRVQHHWKDLCGKKCTKVTRIWGSFLFSHI